uniref:Adducin 1 (alpha) n=1 Tax=Cyprinodon variegatus TaxID=28743 RepID=A0A3Q2DBL0_CYPVA
MLSLEAEIKHSSYKPWMILVIPVTKIHNKMKIFGQKLNICSLDDGWWGFFLTFHIKLDFNFLNSDQERFLIVPFGLLYSEVTASSLVKIDLQGEIVDRGSTNLGVNQAGFTLHSAIYAARPDIKCIVHIHTAAGAAVSAMKCGLLPISPEALSLGEVSYHDYHGILVDDEERVLIQKNLGAKSKVLILRNHGLVSVGETVEEAFYYIHNLVTACEIQVRTLASAGGPDNLVMLDPSKYKSRPCVPEPAGDGSSSHPKWQIGEQEFEALMRMLDNLGYRTGYPYRCPALRDKGKKYSDTELASSAHGGYSYGEDSDSGARSPLKHSFQRGQRDKTRWLNAGGRPDEPYEDGPDGTSPKSKPKVWTNITHDHVKPLLQSLSSGVCVPSCITNCLWTKEESLRQAAVANQFIPMNTDPKEVLEMRNKIREQNLQDIKTAGPQSQVLCSGSVVERSFNQGELVTASKAIIEKEYQPKVIVSKTGPNPFNKFTDQELEEYRREVEQKQKGGEDLEQQVEAEEDDPKPTSTPPSTPVRAEEESLPEQTFKDESDAATLRQTLPDLTPDDPSDAPALPAEDSTPAAASAEAAEGEEAADAGDQEGEESPSKSPSKKKKKFRTPSFLKKNKK